MEMSMMNELTELPPAARRRLATEWRLAAMSDLCRVLQISGPPPVFRARFPVPLAIGISEQILERYPHVNPEILSIFLNMWTGSTKYLQAIANGGDRYDLDVRRTSEITELQIAHASRRLAARAKRCKKGDQDGQA